MLLHLNVRHGEIQNVQDRDGEKEREGAMRANITIQFRIQGDVWHRACVAAAAHRPQTERKVFPNCVYCLCVLVSWARYLRYRNLCTYLLRKKEEKT